MGLVNPENWLHLRSVGLDLNLLVPNVDVGGLEVSLRSLPVQYVDTFLNIRRTNFEFSWSLSRAATHLKEILRLFLHSGSKLSMKMLFVVH